MRAMESEEARVSIREGISDTAIQHMLDRRTDEKIDWEKIKKSESQKRVLPPLHDTLSKFFN